MQTPIAFIVVFGTIVFFHELGHFLVAKLAGVTVFEFALGFGPAILKKKIGPTTYAIRIIPLGGFVKLAGMDEPEDIRTMWMWKIQVILITNHYLCEWPQLLVH